MTTASHDGAQSAVVHSEPATWESRLPNVNRTMLADGVTREVWSDGGITFACDACGSRHTTAQGALQHIGWKHRDRKALRVVQPGESDVTVRGLAQAIEALVSSHNTDSERTILKLQSERDEWRTRAKDAEKRLATLKKALA